MESSGGSHSSLTDDSFLEPKTFKFLGGFGTSIEWKKFYALIFAVTCWIEFQLNNPTHRLLESRHEAHSRVHCWWHKLWCCSQLQDKGHPKWCEALLSSLSPAHLCHCVCIQQHNCPGVMWHPTSTKCWDHEAEEIGSQWLEMKDLNASEIYKLHLMLTKIPLKCQV